MPSLDPWEALWAPYDEATYTAVLAAIQPDDVVLEIGAGDLRLACRIANLARRVTAWEIQADVLARAPRPLPANLSAANLDARSALVPPGTTAAVLLMRHCTSDHYALYTARLRAAGCRRLITNARWRMGVEVVNLAPGLPLEAAPPGWYTCRRCGAVGFLEPDVRQSDEVAHDRVSDIEGCPVCLRSDVPLHAPGQRRLTESIHPLREDSSMRLQGKRIAFLIGPGFEDLEFWVVYMRLIEEGARVTVVGPKADETFTSKHGGLTAKSEAAASDLSPDQFEALVIPGGWAPDSIRRNAGILALTKGIYEQGKTVGLICHAGLVGISAKIVAGHRATGSLGIKDDLINAGATWVDAPAFCDGNLVWGRVVEDIPAFCRELVTALER